MSDRDARAERLAAELRANLKRRKERARALADAATDPMPAPPTKADDAPADAG